MMKRILPILLIAAMYPSTLWPWSITIHNKSNGKIDLITSYGAELICPKSPKIEIESQGSYTLQTGACCPRELSFKALSGSASGQNALKYYPPSTGFGISCRNSSVFVSNSASGGLMATEEKMNPAASLQESVSFPNFPIDSIIAQLKKRASSGAKSLSSEEFKALMTNIGLLIQLTLQDFIGLQKVAKTLITRAVDPMDSPYEKKVEKYFSIKLDETAEKLQSIYAQAIDAAIEKQSKGGQIMTHLNPQDLSSFIEKQLIPWVETIAIKRKDYIASKDIMAKAYQEQKMPAGAFDILSFLPEQTNYLKSVILPLLVNVDSVFILPLDQKSGELVKNAINQFFAAFDRFLAFLYDEWDEIVHGPEYGGHGLR